MSLLSPLQSGVGLSSFTALLLSTFVLNIKNLAGEIVTPEVLHHDSCSQVHLSGPRKVLTSPGYPKSYRNSTSCKWIILAAMDEVVTLSFDDIDLEDDVEGCRNPPCCNLSWIKIGPDHEKRYCGQDSDQKLPEPIIKSGTVWIKFHTALRSRGGRGFKLTFVVGKKHVSSCFPDEFQCADKGNCILSEWICNKRNECLDKSDEKDCQKKLCTRLGQLQCKTGQQCYNHSQRCDGYMDCLDFSDELDCGRCGSNMTACGASPHVCYNPYLSRCNWIMDCPNGEDEQGCSPYCQSREIACTTGSGCYSINERCNGVPQCSDTSDERNCRPDLCRSEQGGFLCHNRHCIRETWRCDRTNDCGDQSDEINCLRNSVIAAAVIGSLICGLLLIIAISCSCKLYALRHSDTHSSGLAGTSGGSGVSAGSGSSGGGETPLSRLEREFMYREPPPAYAIAVGGMTAGPQWGDCPPPRMESRPRRNRRRAFRHEQQHSRICQSSQPASCSSPTTGESSVASTSSAASSPSVLSMIGDNPSGLTSPNEMPLEPSTSQNRKKTSSTPRWPGLTAQQESELKPEMVGELLNGVEMTITSDVVPLLP